MIINSKEAFNILQGLDDILILTHSSPDGDAIGSAYGLCHILRGLGKRAAVLTDTVAKTLSFAADKSFALDFEPQAVVTTDVADIKLIPDDYKNYAERGVILAIDHHTANKAFAENTLLDSKAAAACQVIYDMLTENAVAIDKAAANCLYLGIATDTGCFRYSNTAPATLRAAAALIEAGADNARINNDIFETQSPAVMDFETEALCSMTYHFDGRCALMVLPQDMYKKHGVTTADTTGIAALTRRREGVLVGVVLKETEKGSWKVSMRSNEPVSAAEICMSLGGGGHRLAAGAELFTTLNEAKKELLDAIEKAL